MRKTLSILLIAAAIAGCGAILGIGDVSEFDASADGGGIENAAADANVPDGTEAGGGCVGAGCPCTPCVIDQSNIDQCCLQ